MSTKHRLKTATSAVVAIILVAGMFAINTSDRPTTEVRTAAAPIWNGKTFSAHDAQLETRLAAEAEAARVAAEQRALQEAARQAEVARQAQVRAQAARASRARATRPPVQSYSGDLSNLVDRLAMCESGMNPRANTGNGFYGAFQFMLSTWRRFRPGNPIDYSYAEQKAVIMQYFPISSWRSQFPTCARRLGVA